MGSADTESPPHFLASDTLSNTADGPSSADSATPSPHGPAGGESPVSTKNGAMRAAPEDAQQEKVTEHSTPPSRPTSLPTVWMRSVFVEQNQVRYV